MNTLNKATQQLNWLRNQINGIYPSTGKGLFYMFPIEAGIGKTRTMVETLKELTIKQPWKKSVVVTALVKDAKNIAKEIGKGNAVAIYAGAQVDEHRLSDVPVIVITHQKYRLLCNTNIHFYRQQKDIIFAGRHNLIIDEELHLLDTVGASYEDFYRVRQCFKECDVKYLELFDNAFGHLMKAGAHMHDKGWEAHIYKGKRVLDIDLLLEKTVKLKEFPIGLSLGKILWDDYMPRSKEELYSWTLDLCNIAKADRYFCDGFGFCALNNNCDYISLENNIILDASANLYEIYKESPHFKVMDMPMVRTYKKWKLHHIYANTSASYKKAHSNWLEKAMPEVIKMCTPKDRKILIIGSKKDMGDGPLEGKTKKAIQKKLATLKNHAQVEYTYFQVMRGKNNWRDFDTCIVLHTPAKPPSFVWSMVERYAPHIKMKKNGLHMQRNGKDDTEHYGCADPILDQVREDDLLSTIYQAVNRINRSNEKNAEILLITRNTNLVTRLKRRLVGIRNGITPRKQKIRRQKNVSTDRCRQLKKLLDEIIQGRHMKYETDDCCYPKSYLSKKLGVRSISPYLKKIRVFLRNRAITVHNRYLKISKYDFC